MLNITRFSTCCVKCDYYSEYVPGVSTITSLIDLFLKYAVRPCLSEAYLEKNHYFTYLEEKLPLRCVICLVPVIGNLCMAVFELFFIKNARDWEKRAKETNNDVDISKYYYNAAQGRSIKASYKYGCRLLSGSGFQRPDPNEAKRYLRAAAVWGHQKAQQVLAGYRGSRPC